MNRPDAVLDAQVGFLTRRFDNALNARDQEALANVFEPQAVVVTEPGKIVKASEQDHGGVGFESLAAELGCLHIAVDLAMLLVDFTLVTRNAEGQRVRITGRSTDIGRRAADGQWRCLIDNGFGGGPAHAERARPGTDSALDNTVGELAKSFREALQRRDDHLLCSLFETDAVYVNSSGISSKGPIRHANLGTFSIAGEYESAIRHLYKAEDVALIIEDWYLPQRNQTGEVDTVSGTGTHVARLGADGRWRYVIYNAP